MIYQLIKLKTSNLLLILFTVFALLQCHYDAEPPLEKDLMDASRILRFSVKDLSPNVNIAVRYWDGLYHYNIPTNEKWKTGSDGISQFYLTLQNKAENSHYWIYIDADGDGQFSSNDRYIWRATTPFSPALTDWFHLVELVYYDTANQTAPIILSPPATFSLTNGMYYCIFWPTDQNAWHDSIESMKTTFDYLKQSKIYSQWEPYSSFRMNNSNLESIKIAYFPHLTSSTTITGGCYLDKDNNGSYSAGDTFFPIQTFFLSSGDTSKQFELVP